MTVVFFGLGSNMSPEENLRLGVRELTRRYGELTLSPVYQSAAVGFDGEDFLNFVAACDTDDSIESIVAEIETIHAMAGRKRGEERFSSRTLDIDLLLVGDTVTDGPPASLPRSDVLEWAFVLKPLADIAPNLRHPVTQETVSTHWMQYDQASQPLTEVTLEFD